MATTIDAFAIAVQYLHAGDVHAAGRVCRGILDVQPAHADALHILGVIHGQARSHSTAVEYISRALAIRPNWPEALSNLGNVYRDAGTPSDAVPLLRRSLQLQPDQPVANHILGNALEALGELDEAITCYRRAIELAPGIAEWQSNLGNALKAGGRLDEAIACYQRAAQLKPDCVAAYYNLGVAWTELAKTDEAIAAYRRALELKPDFPEALNNLGNALRARGDLVEAIGCYRRALELNPEYFAAHNNLSIALSDCEGGPAEAVACSRRLLSLQPDCAEMHRELGVALNRQGDISGAIACLRRALELKPDLAPAHNSLGNALRNQGMLGEAIKSYRRALELEPDNTIAHSNLLCTLHYGAGITPAALAEAHAEFNRRHAAHFSSAAVRHKRKRTLDDRVCLGFVSPDLGRHPVGYFLVRVLESLDRQRYETVCYSDRIAKDEMTRRIEAAATRWRDVMSMGDDRLAEQIHADGVDILFDLAGHTANHRLLVFARKPAPIQITWIGYEGTTGLEAMDYLLADDLMIAPDEERYYRERVLRMPNGYLCYDPPALAPPVDLPPCVNRGFGTFGSFNNPAKITPEVVAVWARILRAAPTARLLMKYRGLGDACVRKRFLDLFAVHDVGPERVELRPWSSYADYLATYREVDVVLDPFPFSGSATTCESLWMGVPVVTMPGETFASRHSLSHLTSVGLTELVARGPDEYVELAVSLAGDSARIAGLRSELRQRMALSPLCDGRRFARHFEALMKPLV
jgi:protein O-GlcNAc transferase